MASYVKYEQFVEDLANGVHNFGSNSFKFFLTNRAPVVGTDATLADAVEIAAGNGYSAGGAAVTITSATQTGGTLSVVPAGDVVITASGGSIGPFRYVGFYNDTSASDSLVSSYDYGSSISLNDGESFTIDVGATLFTLV